MIYNKKLGFKYKSWIPQIAYLTLTTSTPLLWHSFFHTLLSMTSIIYNNDEDMDDDIGVKWMRTIGWHEQVNVDED